MDKFPVWRAEMMYIRYLPDTLRKLAMNSCPVQAVWKIDDTQCVVVYVDTGNYPKGIANPAE